MDVTFYRGGAAIMASDLAGTASSGLRAQPCGDAHLSNFGMFETPERSSIYGLNDFDGDVAGPFEGRQGLGRKLRDRRPRAGPERVRQ